MREWEIGVMLKGSPGGEAGEWAERSYLLDQVRQAVEAVRGKGYALADPPRIEFGGRYMYQLDTGAVPHWAAEAELRFSVSALYPPTLDLKIRSNVTRARAPVDVLFCSSAIPVSPGSGNRTLPPNWVVSACMRVSTADTIPYAATRIVLMSSLPDHASAQQWMVTCSSRPRRPSAAHACCESAAGSAAGLSGSVRPTNSLSPKSRAVVGGPS